MVYEEALAGINSKESIPGLLKSLKIPSPGVWDGARYKLQLQEKNTVVFTLGRIMFTSLPLKGKKLYRLYGYYY